LPPAVVPLMKSPPTPVSSYHLFHNREPETSDSYIGFKDGISCNHGEDCCCREYYSAMTVLMESRHVFALFHVQPMLWLLYLPPTKAPLTPVVPTEPPLTTKSMLLPTVKPMHPSIEVPKQAPPTPEMRSIADILPYKKNLSILHNLLNGAGHFWLLNVLVNWHYSCQLM
jgi:hypothetical protein